MILLEKNEEEVIYTNGMGYDANGWFILCGSNKVRIKYGAMRVLSGALPDLSKDYDSVVSRQSAFVEIKPGDIGTDLQ